MRPAEPREEIVICPSRYNNIKLDWKLAELLCVSVWCSVRSGEGPKLGHPFEILAVSCSVGYDAFAVRLAGESAILQRCVLLKIQRCVRNTALLREANNDDWILFLLFDAIAFSPIHTLAGGWQP